MGEGVSNPYQSGDLNIYTYNRGYGLRCISRSIVQGYMDSKDCTAVQDSNSESFAIVYVMEWINIVT